MAALLAGIMKRLGSKASESICVTYPTHVPLLYSIFVWVMILQLYIARN